MNLQDTETLWKAVKDLRWSFDFDNIKCADGKTLFTDEKIIENIFAIEEAFDFDYDVTYSVFDGITTETYEEAAKMFIYLNFCLSDDPLLKWLRVLKEIFQKEGIGSILINLNRIRILNTGKPLQEIAEKIINMIENDLGLQYSKLRDVPNKELQENLKNQKISNHPVHIIDEDGNLSPSAFIPFCALGADTSIVGTKIKEFTTPVCNSFEVKLRNDQLCYEISVEHFTNKMHQEHEQAFKLGLLLVLDYNEDLQIMIATEAPESNSNFNFSNVRIDDSQEHTIEEAHVYLDLLGTG